METKITDADGQTFQDSLNYNYIRDLEEKMEELINFSRNTLRHDIGLQTATGIILRKRPRETTQRRNSLSEDSA